MCSQAVDARAADTQWRRLARDAATAPWLHGEVARRMAERLALVRTQPATIIDWGAFLGGGGDALTAAYPRARRIVVEPHHALHERSLRAAHRPWWTTGRWSAPRIEVIEAASLADGAAQLLWSNMALHCAVDPAVWLARWRRAVAVDGFIMFSTFGPDTLAELRRWYRELGWPAPVQQFVDMHDIGDWLVHAGFADPVMDQEHLTLTWPGPRELLAELRLLGGNLNPQRHAALRTPRWRARLESAIADRADSAGRIAVGFEIVYGHAFVAPPRVPVTPHAEVALDQLRAMARRGRGA
jgi:malonyl-CoA O-methyltransferase